MTRCSTGTALEAAKIQVNSTSSTNSSTDHVGTNYVCMGELLELHHSPMGRISRWKTLSHLVSQVPMSSSATSLTLHLLCHITPTRQLRIGANSSVEQVFFSTRRTRIYKQTSPQEESTYIQRYRSMEQNHFRFKKKCVTADHMSLSRLNNILVDRISLFRLDGNWNNAAMGWKSSL